MFHNVPLQLAKANSDLSSKAAELADVTVKLRALESETSSRIEMLTQRSLKAETQAAEEARQKADIASKLSAAETQVRNMTFEACSVLRFVTEKWIVCGRRRQSCKQLCCACNLRTMAC